MIFACLIECFFFGTAIVTYEPPRGMDCDSWVLCEVGQNLRNSNE